MAKKTKVPKKTVFLHLRLEDDQRSTFTKAAKTLGLSLSSWVRSTLVAAAKRVQAEEAK